MLHSPVVFQVLLALHLVGLALGLGAVGVADFSFVRSLRSSDHITPETVAWMRFFSKVIWLGLFILTVSGIGLLLLDPHKYLSSPGFLAKLTFVLILTLNGIVLNTYITASLTTYSFSEQYQRHGTAWRARKLTFVCGAISTTSWYAAFFAAMFKSLVHFSYLQYLLIYELAIVVAGGTALALDQLVYRYLVHKYRRPTPSAAPILPNSPQPVQTSISTSEPIAQQPPVPTQTAPMPAPSVPLTPPPATTAPTVSSTNAPAPPAGPAASSQQ